jgi:hypothetical protein
MTLWKRISSLDRAWRNSACLFLIATATMIAPSVRAKLTSVCAQSEHRACRRKAYCDGARHVGNCTRPKSYTEGGSVIPTWDYEATNFIRLCWFIKPAAPCVPLPSTLGVGSLWSRSGRMQLSLSSAFLCDALDSFAWSDGRRLCYRDSAGTLLSLFVQHFNHR